MNSPARMRFSTTDPEETTAKLAAIIPQFGVGKRASGRFSYDVDAVRLHKLTLLRVSTKNIRVLAEPGQDCISITIPVRKGFEIRRSGRRDYYDKDAAYIHNLERRFDLASPDITALVVNCDNSSLVETAAKLGAGRREPPLELHDRLSLSGRDGSRVWRDVCSLWSRISGDEADAESEFEIAERERNLMADILLAVGHTDEEAGSWSLKHGRYHSGVNLVEDWILANLDQPISRADLCAVSELPVRALSRYFSNTHDKGPMQFVRDRRLDAIYRALLAADPAATTVTQTALDYGCYHLGRFSADYCRAFGEYPADTLKR